MFDNKKIFIPWIVLMIYLFIFFSGYLQGFDQIMYNMLSSLHHPIMHKIVIGITSIGAWYGMLLIGVIVWLVNHKKGLILSMNMFIVFIINSIIKSIVMRPRPAVLHLVHETSFSFPSGHSMVSFAVFGLIAYFLYKEHKRYAYMIMVIPILIGLSRIYLGVHYASDVLGGFLFSYVWLCSMIPLLKKYNIIE